MTNFKETPTVPDTSAATSTAAPVTASAARDARYPFTAVVGLADLKLALILNAVSPRVGGVLVRGEKGTAKSTIVRALAALLPPVEVVRGCRFSCDPAAPDPGCPDGPHGTGGASPRPARLVELPVGASEDRLAGSLDIERALTEGVKAFEPGLLAGAHRGVLYVDEVNLLHDHLVDLLLDAAALGTCYVEREGVSVRHAARFLLVGTMNPEEGELRPQLLDRFGLTVEVRASRDPAERAEVVRRRLAFEAGPAAFAADWAVQEAALAARIAQARARVPHVVLPDAALRRIATVCAGFDVDGLRADLVTANAAIAHAAWQGRTRVTAEDVREAARLALPHRRRRDPFDAPGLDESRLDDLLAQVPDDPEDDGPEGGPGAGGPTEDGGPETGRSPGADGAPSSGDDAPASGGGDAAVSPETEGGHDDPPATAEHGPVGPPADGDGDPSETAGHDCAAGRPPAQDPETGHGHGERIAEAGPLRRTRLFTVPGVGAGAPGRRSRARTPLGRTIGARVPDGRPASVHLPATVLAAAPYQGERGRTGPGLLLRRDDLREAVREGREGNLVLLVVDASGSMAARRRMQTVKAAVLSLLLDAYQRRDKVGLITFRGARADLVLPPTSSVEAGAARLRELPTGGRTPLAAGLLRAAEVLRTERLRDPARRPLLVLVTDGRATSGTVEESHRAAGLLTGVASVVVDCESGHVRLGLARSLARRMGAETVRLDDLTDLAGLVRERRTAA
ncbi:magnesium chelatase subunit D family protein [Planomonospora sp. ID67723]|uniref:magnesium chelatase subunit D family protein n=1 Tax=Planomonospora sp. ID67723 TaxID=2738134 RepID=UPI0018C3AED0|nr:magnesium chelatase subunit D family protein [Planomonospora sp. ID67723]MBG0833040.1 magnesium chelatase subunit D family protein [Planomonospora sp. ID67723]